MTQSHDWTRHNRAALLFLAVVAAVLVVVFVVWFIPLGRDILGQSWIDKAPWSLAHKVTPDATNVDIVVLDRSCGAAGSSPGGRMLNPTVLYGADSITITVELVSNGSGDCLGHGEYPATVTLSEPIGNRALLDGSLEEPRSRPRPLI